MLVNCKGDYARCNEQFEPYQEQLDKIFQEKLGQDLPTRLYMLKKIVEAFAQGEAKVRQLFNDPSVNLEILFIIIGKNFKFLKNKRNFSKKCNIFAIYLCSKT